MTSHAKLSSLFFLSFQACLHAKGALPSLSILKKNKIVPQLFLHPIPFLSTLLCPAPLLFPGCMLCVPSLHSPVGRTVHANEGSLPSASLLLPPLVLSGLSRDSEQQLIHPVALTVTCEVLQYSAPDSQVPRFMNAHLWSEFELSIVSLI